MAKFSQALLQSLMQPSYQEGLFTAAQGLGGAPRLAQQQAVQEQEAEKFSNLNTVGQLDFAITKANQSGDFGAAARLATTRDKYILDIAKKTADATKVKQESYIDAVSNVLFKANQSEVPDTISAPDGSEAPIPLDLRDKIAKRLTEMYEDSNARALASGKGELYPESFKALKDNRKNLNPTVQAELRKWEGLKDKPASGEKRRLALVLNQAADSIKEKSRQARKSKEGLEIRVDAIIKQITDIGSFTNWGFGVDVAEFLMDESRESENYKKFRRNMAQALREGISDDNLEAVIAKSIVGLEKQIDGEDKGRRGRQLDKFQLRQAVIDDFVSKGMSPEEAEDTVRKAEESR
jgi:hypothetical protein